MRRTVLITAALSASIVLTACSASKGNDKKPDNRRSSQTASTWKPQGEIFIEIGSAVKFTCPKGSEGQPERSFYLHNKQVQPADIKFGTELTIGRVSVTPHGCTWGYEYNPDDASSKSLGLYPESLVTPRHTGTGQDEYQEKGSGYEQGRSHIDSLQLQRGETVWMVLEAPSKSRSIKLKLSCVMYSDRPTCVTNWAAAQKGLHKITQQP